MKSLESMEILPRLSDISSILDFLVIRSVNQSLGSDKLTYFRSKSGKSERIKSTYIVQSACWQWALGRLSLVVVERVHDLKLTCQYPRIDKTQPNMCSADETADVGVDNQTPVAPGIGYGSDETCFTDKINKLVIEVE